MKVASDGTGWRLLDADGSTRNIEAFPEIPSDVVPGEFVLINEGPGGWRWYIVCDKTRSWDGVRWKVGGTLSQFDPGNMTEREIYEHRCKMLEWGGWIDR